MSVQKVLANFSVVTNCPLIITPAETVLTYQTASSISSVQNVNGRSGECFPNGHVYQQIKSPQQPAKCCTNNALKSYNKNLAGSMNQGY